MTVSNSRQVLGPGTWMLGTKPISRMAAEGLGPRTIIVRRSRAVFSSASGVTRE